MLRFLFALLAVSVLLGTLATARRSRWRWPQVLLGLAAAGALASAGWVALVMLFLELADSGNPGLWLVLTPAMIPAGVVAGAVLIVRHRGREPGRLDAAGGVR